jgi:hypothetical protein
VAWQFTGARPMFADALLHTFRHNYIFLKMNDATVGFSLESLPGGTNSFSLRFLRTAKKKGAESAFFVIFPVLSGGFPGRAIALGVRS